MRTITKHPPPYVLTHRRTTGVMGEVCISLFPPCTAAVWFFGWQALWLLLTATVTSVATDRITARLRRTTHPFDGAAAVTGLILALSCPAGTPLWLLALMCVVAIGLFREAFGGIGANLFNPAMAARAVLLVVFPAFLSGYALPDAVSTATPLADPAVPLWLLWLGRVGGSMGETSAAMILLGGGYLIYRRIVRWQVPVFALAAFALVTVACGGDVIRQLLSGSILFGAVYIVTDYTGRPITPLGEAVCAAGFGAAVALLRAFGRYPEGVCFAILIINGLSPLLEHLTLPRVYGTKRKERWV